MENQVEAIQKTEVGALALITLQPEQYAAEVYQPFKNRLAAAIESVRSIDYDVTTTKGLDVVTKARRLMMDIRIEANKERLARKAPITQIGKLLESCYSDVEALVLPLETFFDGDIKAEEQRKEDEKLAKIAAERVRMEAHEAAIASIHRIPADMADKSAIDIAYSMQSCGNTIVGDEWEEYKDRAAAAYAETIDRLEELRKTKLAAEEKAIADAAAAEAERLRVIAEQAEIERNRVAQAAEAQRLADQQAEVKRQADELAAARAQFEADKLAAQAPAADPVPEVPLVDPRQIDLVQAITEQEATTTAAPVGILVRSYGFSSSIPTQAPTEAPASPPTLRLGRIGELLGPTISAEFLAELGFVHAKASTPGKFYHEREFPLICDAFIARIQKAKAEWLAK